MSFFQLRNISREIVPRCDYNRTGVGGVRWGGWGLPSAAEAACGKGLPPCWPLAAEAACGEGTRRADKWPAGGRRKKGARGLGGAGFGGWAGRPQPKTALQSCGGQVFEKMT